MRDRRKLLLGVDYLSSQGIGSAISQFLGEVERGFLDFLAVDLCPGTGGEEERGGRKMNRDYDPS